MAAKVIDDGAVRTERRARGSGVTLVILAYGATIFLAAFLLFWIQPLAAKALLPVLGGSPAVWVLSLAFFQTVLLAGYGYAHLMSRWFSVRGQALAHIAAIALACTTLPVVISTDGQGAAETPRLWLLHALLRSIGPTFFVIAATAPLVQRWFAFSSHGQARDPYFLYAASNAGSFFALLAFPFLLEPSLRMTDQQMIWSTAFAMLGVLLVACAAMTGLPSAPRDRAAVSPQATAANSTISWRERFRWLVLAAVPSSLLLGVTTHVSTDIAAVPLLWIIPLAIYLLTFVVAFARRPIVPVRLALWAQAFLVVAVGAIELRGIGGSWEVRIAFHLAAFAATALVCHGSLAVSRPNPERLTEFYLWLALGGALGGWFNALLSPLIFGTVIEYPLALVLACLLRPGAWPDPARRLAGLLDVTLPALLFLALTKPFGLDAIDWLYVPSRWKLAAGIALVVLAAVLAAGRPLRLALGVAALLLGTIVLPDLRNALHVERNFFGVIRVKEWTPEEEGGVKFHILFHGSTMHGAQSVDPAWRLQPGMYYHPTGPLGQLLTRIGGTERTRRVALVGLGVAATACYGHPGEDWTFFEIDPAVERVARTRAWFTYLDDCPPRPQVLIGDARVTLKTQFPQHFSLIILDAFSSDAIPLHLLTREALALYLDKLAPGGLILVHISNRYADLGPVIAKTAETLGLSALRADDDDATPLGSGDLKLASNWMVIARGPDDLAVLDDDLRWQPIASAPRPWTDDHSDILTVLKW